MSASGYRIDDILNEYDTDEDDELAVNVLPSTSSAALPLRASFVLETPQRSSFSAVSQRAAPSERAVVLDAAKPPAAAAPVPSTPSGPPPDGAMTPMSPLPRFSRMEVVAAAEKQLLTAGNDTLRSPLEIKRRQLSQLQSQASGKMKKMKRMGRGSLSGGADSVGASSRRVNPKTCARFIVLTNSSPFPPSLPQAC